MSEEDRLRELLSERADQFALRWERPVAMIRRGRLAMALSAVMGLVLVSAVGAGAFVGVQTLRGPSSQLSASTTTAAHPRWEGSSKALLDSVRSWGPGATLAEAPCSPAGTSLEIATPTSDVLSYSTDCLAAPANTAFTISFTNSITATNGDLSSIGLSIYDSPDDAFIAGDQVSPWTVTSATEANALFRGEDVTTGKTIEYHVGPLEPGTYYFQDDFHPLAMNGVLIVQ